MTMVVSVCSRTFFCHVLPCFLSRLRLFSVSMFFPAALFFRVVCDHAFSVTTSKSVGPQEGGLLNKKFDMKLPGCSGFEYGCVST